MHEAPANAESRQARHMQPYPCFQRGCFHGSSLTEFENKTKKKKKKGDEK